MNKSKWFALFALVLFGSFAQAAKLPDFAKAGVTTTGNSAKIGMTGNGVPWGSTIPVSPTVGGWSQAGNYGIPAAAKGPTMTMGASGDVFFAGTKYPFQAGYTLPAATVWDGLASAAGVVGSLAGGPAGLAILAAGTAAPYIKQWLEDSNLRAKPGENKIQQGDSTYCGTAPCYEWRGNTNLPWNRSAKNACLAWVAANTSFNYYDTVMLSAQTAQCQTRWKSGGGVNNFNMLNQARAPDASKNWTDLASMDDIAPYMKSTNFDPRVVPEILAQGGNIPMPAPTITGPTALPGETKVEKRADGTTVTTYNTSNFVISGDTITNISNVSTQITTNSSSTVINSITNITTPAAKDQAKPDDPCALNPDSMMCQPVGTATDTPFGPIPELYVPKYPDGIVGVWNTRKAELTATPLANVLGGLMPSVGSSGTCPSFTIPLHVGIADYGIGDFSPPCWIWDFGKVVIIVSALLLARALVFGG